MRERPRASGCKGRMTIILANLGNTRVHELYAALWEFEDNARRIWFSKFPHCRVQLETPPLLLEQGVGEAARIVVLIQKALTTKVNKWGLLKQQPA